MKYFKTYEQYNMTTALIKVMNQMPITAEEEELLRGSMNLDELTTPDHDNYSIVPSTDKGTVMVKAMNGYELTPEEQAILGDVQICAPFANPDKIFIEVNEPQALGAED